jgi:hypothetical protein
MAGEDFERMQEWDSVEWCFWGHDGIGPGGYEVTLGQAAL